MVHLPRVTTNDVVYVSHESRRMFQSVDDPTDRLSWDEVDAAPDLYVFGEARPQTPTSRRRFNLDAWRPLIVSYIKRPDTSMQLEFSPARDGRPHFHELPLAVRYLARLRYWATWPDHRQKLRVAGNSVLARDAVRNDILYKCAVDAVLDPDVPEHRAYIVDISKDRDDFSLRGVVPFDRKLLDDAPTDDTVLARALFIQQRTYPAPPAVHVVTGPRHRLRFGSYPWTVRLEARLRFLMGSTPRENGILYAAATLPLDMYQAVLDDILCSRADAVMRRERLAFQPGSNQRQIDELPPSPSQRRRRGR